jgi:thiamine biosynthesis lipoprotein
MNQALPFFSDPLLARYSHDAMKTTFQIFVSGGDRSRVDSAVSEAFQKLEDLESLLSRYVPGSDISRINAMKAGESLFLSNDCDQCLRLAIEASVATSGRFDPCIGTLIDAVKLQADRIGEVRGIVSLDLSRPMVSCIVEGRILDLGAIGKGYALECMASILSQHEIEKALLTSGASTILAMGAIDWPIDIPHSSGSRRLMLRQAALGASGSSQQGTHIVDPRDGSPARHFQSVWVVHPRAPFADSFSTACFVMSPAEIREFAKILPPGCQVLSAPDF